MNDKYGKSYDGKEFTVEAYRELLDMARAQYSFYSFVDLPSDDNFILWRHDVDYSMDAALRLAEIENEKGVTATYFISPHSEFYNLFERHNSDILLEIFGMGHQIGLHFDVHYYNLSNEGKLADCVKKEAEWLQDTFDVPVRVFSFHNPTEFTLSCQEWRYGGLINTYAKYLQDNVEYCSDSNGYWRHKRLNEVLDSEIYPRVQFLSHPAWWHEEVRYPREKIFQCVYDRAEATMSSYDETLKAFGRENLDSHAQKVRFLRDIDREKYQYYDYLWHNASFRALLQELWAFHDSQITQLVSTWIHQKWNVPKQQISNFFANRDNYISGPELYRHALGTSFWEMTGTSEEEYFRWRKCCRELLGQKPSMDDSSLEEGCIFLCELISETFRVRDEHLINSKVTSLLEKDSPITNLSDDVEPENEKSISKKWKSFLEDVK